MFMHLILASLYPLFEARNKFATLMIVTNIDSMIFLRMLNCSENVALRVVPQLVLKLAKWSRNLLFSDIQSILQRLPLHCKNNKVSR